jgi:hypothetical protein
MELFFFFKTSPRKRLCEKTAGMFIKFKQLLANAESRIGDPASGSRWAVGVVTPPSLSLSDPHLQNARLCFFVIIPCRCQWKVDTTSELYVTNWVA